MVSRMKFKRRRTNFQFLDKIKNVYTVQSELRYDIVYVADYHRFCIVDFQGLLFCPIEEVPELVKSFKPKFRKEVMEIYQDLQDLKLMEVEYAK